MAYMKDMETRRRSNLERWIKDNWHGNQRSFCQQAEKDENGKPMNPSYVSGVIKGTRSFAESAARNMEERGHIPPRWLDGDHSEEIAQSNEATPLYTPERRADDNVTAVHIAVESLVVALLRKVPGSAEAFVADLKAMCDERGFSMNHALLGRLSGSARTVQSIEEAEDRARRRAGPAQRTKL